MVYAVIRDGCAIARDYPNGLCVHVFESAILDLDIAAKEYLQSLISIASWIAAITNNAEPVDNDVLYGRDDSNARRVSER